MYMGHFFIKKPPTRSIMSFKIFLLPLRSLSLNGGRGCISTPKDILKKKSHVSPFFSQFLFSQELLRSETFFFVQSI